MNPELLKRQLTARTPELRAQSGTGDLLTAFQEIGATRFSVEPVNCPHRTSHVVATFVACGVFSSFQSQFQLFSTRTTTVLQGLEEELASSFASSNKSDAHCLNPPSAVAQPELQLTERSNAGGNAKRALLMI